MLLSLLVANAFASGRDADGDGYDRSVDCVDLRADIHPGAAEVCDGADQNCDGVVDEGVQINVYRDTDGDGYGHGRVILACAAGPGRALQAGDCDVADPTIHPGAAEVCDGIDQDCDGRVDDGVQLTFYRDRDLDGYGSASTVRACSAGAGRVLVGGDCVDEAAAIHPGADEITDGADNDCDGLVDNHVVDLPFEVFLAANFIGSGDCMEASPDGCDLYRISFDEGTWDIAGVEQITSATAQGEVWPSVDRIGATLAYETQFGAHSGELVVRDLASGVEQVIGPARYPAFANTQDILAYNDDDERIHLLTYTTGGGGFSPLADVDATSGRDPEFFPDDATLIFHDQPASEETRTVLYDVVTGARYDWSDPDGCAHATVNDDGNLALCQVGTVIYGRTFDGASWGPYAEVLRADGPRAYGTRYRRCDHTTFAYPTFCGGGNQIAVSLNCVVGGEVTDSSVVVVDIDTGAVVDLHGAIQDFLGVTHTSSRSVACTAR